MRLIKQPALFIVLIGFLSFTSCNNESAGNATDLTSKADSLTKPAPSTVLDLLIGTWQSADGSSFEQWKKKEDGTFRSVAFSVRGTDTSWNEQASIYPENGNWVFENTVKGQNDGKAVKFVSTLFTEKTVQFSNPAHDFPTDINYTVPDANTVTAFIVGPNNKGGRDTIPFNFTRKK